MWLELLPSPRGRASPVLNSLTKGLQALRVDSGRHHYARHLVGQFIAGRPT